MSKPDTKQWFTAIGMRHYTQIRELLNIFGGSRNGAQDTGLMVAARIDDPELATILAVQEAGMLNKEAETALIIAAQLDHPKICEILAPLEKGIYFKDGRNALMIAAEAGSVNACIALAREFPVERDVNGYTALDYTVLSNHIACTRAIVDLVYHSHEDLQYAMGLAEESGQNDIYAYLQMTMKKQTLAAEHQEIESLNSLTATVANSNVVRANNALVHRSGSTPMNATLNRSEIRSKSIQKQRSQVRAQSTQSPAYPKHSLYSNNTFHSPVARTVSASGLNNSTAVMNMQASLSGSGTSASQFRQSSPDVAQRVVHMPSSSGPVTSTPILSAAEFQVIQKNPEIRELFEHLKTTTDLKSAPTISKIQKYIANLHMDYDRAVCEKLHVERSMSGTGPHRSVSPATVIAQSDGGKSPSSRGARIIDACGEEISHEQLAAMQKAVKEALSLREEVKKLESEKQSQDICINNLTEALRKVKEDNAIMVRNAQRFAKAQGGGSEDKIYTEGRRGSTDQAEKPRSDSQPARNSKTSTPVVGSAQNTPDVRAQSTDAQGNAQGNDKKLREEIRLLKEELNKAARETSAAIDAKARLEKQISEINEKALEYQAQAETAASQRTEAIEEKLAAEEKLLELQEEILEMKETFELQLRSDEQSDKRRAHELEEANKILASENETLLSQLTDVQSNGSNLNYEVNKLTSQLKEAHEQIDNLNNIVDELTSRNNANTSNPEERRLRETLVTREEELMRAQMEIESLNTVVNNQLSQIADLEGKLAMYVGTQKFASSNTGRKSGSAVQNRRAPPANLRGETQSLYEEFAARSRSELKASAAAQASLLARSQHAQRSGTNRASSKGDGKYLYTSQRDSVGNASNTGTALRDYNLEKSEHGSRPVSRTKFLSLSLIPHHMSAQQILSMRDNLDTTCISTANNRKTDLMDAAEAGDPARVWKFLSYQAGLQDEEGKTALMYAAQKGHLEIVKALIQKEARIQTHFGTTALMDAACNGHTDIVSILVDYEGGMATKGDVNGESAGLTALMLAAHEGHLDCVHVLIRKENNMVCSNGMSARDFAKTDEIRNLLDAFHA